MKTNLLFTVFLSVIGFVFTNHEVMAQSKFKADKIEYDQVNGDGAFRARDKKTKKWGMFQGSASGQPDEMIPMKYDKVDFFGVNASFTGVYNDGKVGIYLCKWSYEDKVKQTVPCEYEDYQIMEAKSEDYDVMKFNNTTEYLAMKKNGKWGWVDWMTGEEKSEFIYKTPDDLPKPTWQQKWSVE